jgi:biopolymer transport protein ExbB
MATTFRAFMSGGEYATAQALATGMWQALLTAGAALALAIPAHLAHHLLHGRVRSIVRDVEWAGNEIMRYLLIEYRDTENKGKPAANLEETSKAGRGTSS